jgi:hypothetical protein
MRNQFRWVVRILLAGIMGFAGSAHAADDSARRPRVAIVDFDATPGGWTLPPPVCRGEEREQLDLAAVIQCHDHARCLVEHSLRQRSRPTRNLRLHDFPLPLP